MNCFGFFLWYMFGLRLLSMVAAQDNIKLVDVTGIARAMKEATKSEDTITNSSITEQPTASNKIKKNKCDSVDTTLRSTKTSEEKASNEAITTASSAPSQTPLSLPKGLTQYELRAPLGDKDTLLYLFLIRVSHIIFFITSHCLIRVHSYTSSIRILGGHLYSLIVLKQRGELTDC